MKPLRFTLLITATLLAFCQAPVQTDKERHEALERDAQAACACETRTHGPARAQCWRAFDAKAIDQAFERVLDSTNDVPAAIAAGLAVSRRAPTLIVDDIPPAGVPGQ